MPKTSIVIKMLLSTFFFTILPLIISGLLIIYAYQSLIDELLTERGIEFSEGIIKGLSLALQGAEIQAFLTLLIVIVLSLFSNIIISRNLTRPLKRLLKGTDEVGQVLEISHRVDLAFACAACLIYSLNF